MHLEASRHLICRSPPLVSCAVRLACLFRITWMKLVCSVVGEPRTRSHQRLDSNRSLLLSCYETQPKWSSYRFLRNNSSITPIQDGTKHNNYMVPADIAPCSDVGRDQRTLIADACMPGTIDVAQNRARLTRCWSCSPLECRTELPFAASTL